MRKHWKKPLSRESRFKHVQGNSKEERTWKNDTIVYCCRCNLHQKSILTARIVKQQNKHRGEVVKSPLLEVFENGLDKTHRIIEWFGLEETLKII